MTVKNQVIMAGARVAMWPGISQRHKPRYFPILTLSF